MVSEKRDCNHIYNCNISSVKISMEPPRNYHQNERSYRGYHLMDEVSENGGYQQGYLPLTTLRHILYGHRADEISYK